MSDIATTLHNLGIELPEATRSAGNYVGYVRQDDLVFISGQIPISGGEPQFVAEFPIKYLLKKQLRRRDFVASISSPNSMPHVNAT